MSKRLKFFLNHLSISFLIAVLVVGIVFFIWYPSPLAKAAGVTHIFLMLIIIDVIVGPILGFLVYKEGKKTLKFDLTIIILLQISALSYGIYSIAQGRPAWLVFYADHIELVRKNELILDRADQVHDQYKEVSWFKPQYVAIKPSKDIAQHNKDMFIEVIGGISPAQLPERYMPLSQANEKIKQKVQDLELLNQYNDKALVEKTLANYPYANAYLPLKASMVDMVVLLNKETAEIIQIVDLRPWK